MENLINDKKRTIALAVIMANAVVITVVVILLIVLHDDNEKNFIGTWQRVETSKFEIEKASKGYKLRIIFANSLEGEYSGDYDSDQKVMRFKVDERTYEFKFDPETGELLRKYYWRKPDDGIVERLQKVGSNAW